MRFSLKVASVLLVITGCYLVVSAVWFYGFSGRDGGVLVFAQTLPGLSVQDPKILRKLFLALFICNWMFFWMKLQAFVEGSKPAAVGAVSLIVFVSPLFSTFLPMPALNRTFALLIQMMASVAFIPIFLGIAFLLLASAIGLERTDPIKTQLQNNVVWPEKVQHDRFLKKSFNTALTYIGFEATLKQPVFISPSERNTHVQVIGSTGSGKTLFTLFPMIRQDIESGRGVIFIDAKGSSSNALAVYDMVKKANRENDFLFFSLTQTNSSRTYNPLQYGNPSQLKDKIAASIEWSEPYYQRVCENALQTLFMDLEAIGKRVTLPGLCEILKNPPPQLPNFSALAERHEKDLQTLFSEINLLVNTPFGTLFEIQEADINLMDIYRNGKVAYFGLDTQSYQHTAVRVGKMITQDLNTLSGHIESSFREEEKKPLAIYIDEFQAFGTRGFINALARGRSSGFWITIAHQSLGDLKAIDESFARQVIENTNTKIILKTNDPETAQFFADSVGTKKTIETTGQVLLEGDVPKNIMGSQRVVHEYRIHPGEFKALEPGQAIFKSGRRSGRLCLPGHFLPNKGHQEFPLKQGEEIPLPSSEMEVPEQFEV